MAVAIVGSTLITGCHFRTRQAHGRHATIWVHKPDNYVHTKVWDPKPSDKMPFLFCTVIEIFARTLFMSWKSHLWSMTTKLADIVTGDADVMLQYVLVPATWGQDAWAPCQYSSPCLVTSHISNLFTARTVPNLFKYQSYLYVNTSYPWNIQTPPKNLKFAMKSGTFESGV